MKKLFEHHHDDKHDPKSTGKGGQQDEGKMESFEDNMKNDERKLKEYYQKDEKLEEEGETYGGLMWDPGLVDGCTLFCDIWTWHVELEYPENEMLRNYHMSSDDWFFQANKY